MARIILFNSSSFFQHYLTAEQLSKSSSDIQKQKSRTYGKGRVYDKKLFKSCLAQPDEE
jgi:hypothetical protein